METHKLYHNHVVYPLFAYVHSGVSLSLGREYPFNCPWDSRQIGFVLVRRDVGRKANRTQAAELCIETWNQYLSGDVYGFVVKDAQGENLDSCCGFYGIEYVREAAREAAKGCIDAETQKACTISAGLGTH